MNAEEQAVRELHARWIEAVNAGDLAFLLGRMTDDVVLMDASQPPFGRDVLAARFNAAHQQHHLRCISEPEEVVVLGDIAYTRCRDHVSVTPRAGGATTAVAGHRLTIYRRQPDGRWLLARDMNTLSPVAP